MLLLSLGSLDVYDLAFILKYYSEMRSTEENVLNKTFDKAWQRCNLE